MLRSEIIRGAQEVTGAIRRSNVAIAMEEALRGPRERVSAMPILGALKEYTLAASSYSAPARSIAEIMGLSPLEDPQYWAALLDDKGDDRGRIRLHDVYSALHHQRTFLPRVIALLDRSQKSHSEEPQIAEERVKGETMTFLLVEAGGSESTPTRLADLFLGVQSLYSLCAHFEGAASEDLAVHSCDSGSDKSFDFAGAAKVVQCVKELMLEIWDRAVFFRERRHEERVKLVAESLPVLERINDGATRGTIDPEQAALLRRVLTDGVGKLIACGAIIPEMEQRAALSPRALMAPERKLLTSGVTASRREDGRSPAPEKPRIRSGTGRRRTSPTTAEAPAPQEPPENELSPEEEATLEALLAKKKGRSKW